MKLVSDYEHIPGSFASDLNQHPGVGFLIMIPIRKVMLLIGNPYRGVSDFLWNTYRGVYVCYYCRTLTGGVGEDERGGGGGGRSSKLEFI